MRWNNAAHAHQLRQQDRNLFWAISMRLPVIIGAIVYHLSQTVGEYRKRCFDWKRDPNETNEFKEQGRGKETKETPTSLMDEDQKGVERHETWLAEAVALPGQ